MDILDIFNDLAEIGELPSITELTRIEELPPIPESIPEPIPIAEPRRVYGTIGEPFSPQYVPLVIPFSFEGLGRFHVLGDPCDALIPLASVIVSEQCYRRFPNLRELSLGLEDFLVKLGKLFFDTGLQYRLSYIGHKLLYYAFITCLLSDPIVYGYYRQMIGLALWQAALVLPQGVTERSLIFGSMIFDSLENFAQVGDELGFEGFIQRSVDLENNISFNFQPINEIPNLQNQEVERHRMQQTIERIFNGLTPAQQAQSVAMDNTPLGGVVPALGNRLPRESLFVEYLTPQRQRILLSYAKYYMAKWLLQQIVRQFSSIVLCGNIT